MNKVAVLVVGSAGSRKTAAIYDCYEALSRNHRTSVDVDTAATPFCVYSLYEPCYKLVQIMGLALDEQPFATSAHDKRDRLLRIAWALETVCPDMLVNYFVRVILRNRQPEVVLIDDIRTESQFQIVLTELVSLKYRTLIVWLEQSGGDSGLDCLTFDQCYQAYDLICTGWNMEHDYIDMSATALPKPFVWAEAPPPPLRLRQSIGLERCIALTTDNCSCVLTKTEDCSRVSADRVRNACKTFFSIFFG